MSPVLKRLPACLLTAHTICKRFAGVIRILHTNHVVQVILEGVCGKDYLGDIAIDDIAFDDKVNSCPTTPPAADYATQQLLTTAATSTAAPVGPTPGK